MLMVDLFTPRPQRLGTVWECDQSVRKAYGIEGDWAIAFPPWATCTPPGSGRHGFFAANPFAELKTFTAPYRQVISGAWRWLSALAHKFGDRWF